MASPGSALLLLLITIVIICLNQGRFGPNCECLCEHAAVNSVSCYTRSNHLTNGNMCVQRSGYFKRRVKYYNNCTACFSFGKIRLIGIHPIPGPDIYSGNVNKFRIRGLYLNARSLVNKTAELQALAVDADMIAVTETWLKPDILNTELLPGNHLQSIGGIEPIKKVAESYFNSKCSKNRS